MIEGLKQIPLEVICKDDRRGFNKKETVYINIFNDTLSFNGCENLNGGQSCKLCANSSLEKFEKEFEELSKQ